MCIFFKQNGLDILDEIPNSEDINGVRVLMSSGSNVKEECMKRGADGFPNETLHAG